MKKVLVVEDNVVNRELVSVVLQVAGFAVIESADAEDAFCRAVRDHPDVILMDVGLPGLDGVAATNLLKRDPRTSNIPVVAVSAHAMKADETRALAAGCAGYVTKPIDTRSLPMIVRSFLRGAA
jgi:CheY-like chemotaxis protein